MVAGNGYGKSLFGARWFYDRLILNYKSKFSLITAPKQDLLRKGPIERLEQVFRDHGLTSQGPFRDYEIVGSPPDIKLRWGHVVMCRSVHDSAVDNLVAVDVSHAWMDEPGLCPMQASTEVAKRVRCPLAAVNQRLYTGTPEGVNWFSEKFGGLNQEGFREVKGHTIATHSTGDLKLVLHGTTFDNLKLKSGYVESLIREFSWNQNLFLAYVLGQFVPIYDFRGYDYDPTKHRQRLDVLPDRPIYLSWDFNVTQGRAGGVSWVTTQEDRADLLCNAENKGSSRTTWEAIDNFITQFNSHKSKEIIVTGDASGYSRDTRGHDDDYSIIRGKLVSAGFRNIKIKAPEANPSVSKRIASVNRLFADGYNARLLVDERCSKVHTSLLQTTIDDKGRIIKPAGETHTHYADALGYGVCLLKPIRERTERAGQDFAFG